MYREFRKSERQDDSPDDHLQFASTATQVGQGALRFDRDFICRFLQTAAKFGEGSTTAVIDKFYAFISLATDLPESDLRALIPMPKVTQLKQYKRAMGSAMGAVHGGDISKAVVLGVEIDREVLLQAERHQARSATRRGGTPHVDSGANG